MTAGNKKVFATATGTIWGYTNQTRSSLATHSNSHIRYGRSCAGTQPPLSRQINEIGGRHHPRDGNPYLRSLTTTLHFGCTDTRDA